LDKGLDVVVMHFYNFFMHISDTLGLAVFLHQSL